MRTPRARTLVVPLLALLFAGLLARDALQLWRALRFNALLDAQAAPAAHAPPPVSRFEPGLVLFVHAHAAARQGRLQDALSLYKDAAADPAVAVAANYNSGNIHLREALELAAQQALAQSPQAVELAKQQYREALRRDPGHWPSRYNLERALWLAPELPDESSTSAAPEHSERAVTTMRGFTIGLP